MWGPVITAMVTPFDRNGGVDLDAAGALACHLAEHGSTGVLLCGTTGESPTLTHGEKLALVQAVKAALGDRAKLLVGTGSNNTQQTVDLTREITDLGVDGIMLVCPYYNKPPQDGLLAHFVAAAQATDLPVMIYNIEGRTARNIVPETIAKLTAAAPNVVALKEASANVGQFAQMQLVTPDGFFLYSGNDSDTPAILCAGGVGIVSVASHLVGDEISEMIASFLGGRFQEGSEMYLRLQPLVEALFPAESPNPSPVKAGLELLGQRVGGVRLPLLPAPETTRNRLQTVLRQLGKL